MKPYLVNVGGPVIICEFHRDSKQVVALASAGRFDYCRRGRMTAAALDRHWRAQSDAANRLPDPSNRGWRMWRAGWVSAALSVRCRDWAWGAEVMS